MKKTSDNKRIILIMAAIAIIAFITGIIIAILVINRSKDKVTRFEWIEALCDGTDIKEHENNEPFYNDVDDKDPSFHSIQAAVEADVIPITKKFEGDKPVTGEYAAVTALRALDGYKRNHSENVPHDKTDEDYLELAIEYGLIEESERDKTLSEKRCHEILAKLSDLMHSNQNIDDVESKDNSVSDEAEPDKSEIEADGNLKQEDDNETTETMDLAGIVLDQHYTTKYGQINAITCPAFSFDYPSNWEVTSEEYDSAGGIIEEVSLRDEDGAMITYIHHGDGAFGPRLKNGTIKEVAESKVVPSYPAGTDTDCSDLGEFVVALACEGDEYSLFGSYAVIPKTQTGDFEDIGTRLSFAYPELWYMFVSYPPEHMNEEEGYSEVVGYSEQEIKEIVAIMSSFRIEE